MAGLLLSPYGRQAPKVSRRRSRGMVLDYASSSASRSSALVWLVGGGGGGGGGTDGPRVAPANRSARRMRHRIRSARRCHAGRVRRTRASRPKPLDMRSSSVNRHRKPTDVVRRNRDAKGVTVLAHSGRGLRSVQPGAVHEESRECDVAESFSDSIVRSVEATRALRFCSGNCSSPRRSKALANG